MRFSVKKPSVQYTYTSVKARSEIVKATKREREDLQKFVSKTVIFSADYFSAHDVPQLSVNIGCFVLFSDLFAPRRSFRRLQ